MLVERDAFRHLAAGSYEQKRSRVVEAIRNWLSEKTVQSILQYKLVASFPTHAIVVNEDSGQTYQYNLENKPTGAVVVTEVRAINGPKVYSEDQKPEYMAAKVSETVHYLSNGILSSDKVASLMMGIDEIDVSSQIIRQLHYIVEADNLWDMYYRENLSEILRETWDAQTLIESRNNCPGSIQQVIYRVADLRKRTEVLFHKKASKVLESINNSLKQMGYWSEKLLAEEFDSYKYSDILKSLVECHIKIDQIISYAEYQGRATR